MENIRSQHLWHQAPFHIQSKSNRLCLCKTDCPEEQRVSVFVTSTRNIILKRKYWLMITFNRNKTWQNEVQSISSTQTSKWIKRPHLCSSQSLSALSFFSSFILIFLQWQVCQIFFPGFTFILIPHSSHLSFPLSMLSLKQTAATH